MKKGQKVRLLQNNTVGVIADSTFFTLYGKKQVRYEVRVKGEREGRWYPAEELGPVEEVIGLTVTGSNGQQLFADLKINWDKSEMNMQLTGSPVNLKEHKGTHLRVMADIVDSFKKDF